MAETTLTASQINTAASNADTEADAISTKGTQTLSYMQGEAANFRGATGTAFRNVLSEFKSDLDVICQRMHALADATRNAGNKLISQDEQGAATVSRAGQSSTSVTTSLTAPTH